MKIPPLTARNVAIGRIVAGTVYLTFPGLLVQTWTGTSAPHVKALGRAIGARDLALGVGALFAIRHDTPSRPWFFAAVLSDAADAIATLIAFPHLPQLSRWAILAAAVTGCATSSHVAREMAASPPDAIRT